MRRDPPDWEPQPRARTPRDPIAEVLAGKAEVDERVLDRPDTVLLDPRTFAVMALFLHPESPPSARGRRRILRARRLLLADWEPSLGDLRRFVHLLQGRPLRWQDYDGQTTAP